MIQYGFIYTDTEDVVHIYPSRVQVMMCFGSEKIASKAGKIVKINIEVIECTT